MLPSNYLQGGSLALQVANSPQSTAPTLAVQHSPGTGNLTTTVNPQDGGSYSFANSGGSGGSGGATYSYDPYAQWGGKANYDSMLSGFNSQKNNIITTADEAVNNQGLTLKNNILDFVGGLRTGQRAIENKSINNELAKKQGTASIIDMVGRGIRSGGVTLANRNSGDSSAVKAIADAYGNLGRRNLSSVNNQYEMGNRNIEQDQLALNEQRDAGVRKIGDSKVQVINSIVSEARNQLAALDAAIANASLPQRINIEQEKESIRQRALGALAQYDQLLANETASIKAGTLDARRAEATRLAGLGQASETAFNFTDQAPLELQNGVPVSGLPIFAVPRNKRPV